jgi:hypothetical protein
MWSYQLRLDFCRGCWMIHATYWSCSSRSLKRSCRVTQFTKILDIIHHHFKSSLPLADCSQSALK